MSGVLQAVFQNQRSFGPPPPSAIGAAYGGGFYGGKINVSGTQYYLIVSPSASGQASGLQWKTTNDATPGTQSVINGPTNTNNMNNADHPAAYFCKGLTIGGYSDWYLPARDELEVLYFFLKPYTDANNTDSGANAYAVSPEPISTNYSSGSPAQTSATAFQLGGTENFQRTRYWSSTEFIDNDSQAWEQIFTTGQQRSDFTKTFGRYVRAIRRVAV